MDVAIPVIHNLLPRAATEPRRIGRLVFALVYLDDDDPWPQLLTWGPGPYHGDSLRSATVSDLLRLSRHGPSQRAVRRLCEALDLGGRPSDRDDRLPLYREAVRALRAKGINKPTIPQMLDEVLDRTGGDPPDPRQVTRDIAPSKWKDWRLSA